jgi:hypothetical protein
VRIFKNKWFARFARKENIEDADLCEAIDKAEHGLIDADLGGGLIKQRVARPGEGRSGGFRSIIAFRKGDRSFFIYGFAKNELDNIGASDLRLLKRLAKNYLQQDESALQILMGDRELQEIVINDQDL